MTTNTYRGSAEIIPFPVRARTTSTEYREAAKPTTMFPVPRAVKVASASGWYHEAAIQDADRTREH
jgi:Protein of unknown function (DUF2735)